jgi:organic hydroperoxide reductase OsmC/OhrA
MLEETPQLVGVARMHVQSGGLMTGRHHEYTMTVRWTGNTGEGTRNYRAYERAHELSAPGKPPILGSSDPLFRGDESRYNPEEMLVGALSACHMLQFLDLASDAGIVVTRYEDAASGTMMEEADGGGRFLEVILRPRIEITSAARSVDEIHRLHERAGALCFIARSVNFPVRCVPATQTVASINEQPPALSVIPR